MSKSEYVKKKLVKYDKIDLAPHAIKRARLRGINPDIIIESLESGDILGARDNENPNVNINYKESYLLLIESENGELYYLPAYFLDEKVLITTVLKLSESNFEVLKW